MLTGSKAFAVTCICSFLLALSVAGFAQDTAAVSTPASSATKIAFVDMQEAVTTCNEGKQAFATLQQKFAPRMNAMKAQDDELRKLKDDYLAVAAKLNDAEKGARAKVIETKGKTFQRNAEDTQSEFQQAEQEAITRITKKMQPVLEKYALVNGYNAVIDVSNSQSPLIWIKRDSMITKQLVDLYNAEYGVPAPPVATAPPRKP